MGEKGTDSVYPDVAPPQGFKIDQIEPDTAFNPESGLRLVWDGESKVWRDTATGARVGQERQTKFIGEKGTLSDDCLACEHSLPQGFKHNPLKAPGWAFNEKTGQALVWDNDNQVWRDWPLGSVQDDETGRSGRASQVLYLPRGVRQKLIVIGIGIVLLLGSTFYAIRNRNKTATGAHTTERSQATPSPTVDPTAKIDPCLIGTWVAVSVSHVGSVFTGGQGFRLTFNEDGTQIADYSSMQPLTQSEVTYHYKGISEGEYQGRQEVLRRNKKL